MTSLTHLRTGVVHEAGGPVWELGPFRPGFDPATRGPLPAANARPSEAHFGATGSADRSVSCRPPAAPMDSQLRTGRRSWTDSAPRLSGHSRPGRRGDGHLDPAGHLHGTFGPAEPSGACVGRVPDPDRYLDTWPIVDVGLAVRRN